MKIDNILAWHVLLPPDILRQAYPRDEELAWARPVAERVIALLEANNYTITSVETWLPATPGPTPLILDWDDTKEQSALDFVQTFDPEHRFGARLGLETYFNIDAEAATRP